jgi:serine/threonine-protein kinase SRPK3
MQGIVPFSGVASKNGSWRVDDDRLARTIEILGNFPPELLRKGNRTGEIFNADGMPKSSANHHVFPTLLILLRRPSSNLRFEIDKS